MWESLFTVLITIVGFVIKRIDASDDMKRSYFNLVQQSYNNGLISAKFKTQYEQDIEALKKQKQ